VKLSAQLGQKPSLATTPQPKDQEVATTIERPKYQRPKDLDQDKFVAHGFPVPPGYATPSRVGQEKRVLPP